MKKWGQKFDCNESRNESQQYAWTPSRRAGASFKLFLGGAKFFFYFSMLPDYWKIGKKQHFICSNLTLFIVPFFLSFFFSLFSLFFYFSFFPFFFFLRGDAPPAPLKAQMTPLTPRLFSTIMIMHQDEFFAIFYFILFNYYLKVYYHRLMFLFSYFGNLVEVNVFESIIPCELTGGVLSNKYAELQRVSRFLDSESSPNPACLESSPSLTGQDSSPNPSPAGLSPSAGVCGWSSPNPSPKEPKFLSSTVCPGKRNP